jgi:two-component sensor histidine kinase
MIASLLAYKSVHELAVLFAIDIETICVAGNSVRAAPFTRCRPAFWGRKHRYEWGMTVQFLEGGGEMGAAVAAFDWSQTELGPIANWPASLKVSTSLILNSRFPQALVWGSSLITLYNDAFRPILGHKPSALGRAFDDVWQEAWKDIGPIAGRALAGEPTFIEDFPLVVERHGYAEQAYFTFCYSPIRDEMGHVRGFIDTVIETTSKVRAEQSARLMNLELAHRLQNTLATVLGIASHTFRSALSFEDCQRDFNDRIAALGRTHSLLSQTSWVGASMQAVVEQAVAPLRGESASIEVHGPLLQLPAHQALSLALALNELGTNAIKYGALSAPHGRVSIAWDVSEVADEQLLRFVWTEREGPSVSSPTRRGFGTRLIEDMLAQEFQGHVSLSYLPQGLRMELTAKVRSVADLARKTAQS